LFKALFKLVSVVFNWDQSTFAADVGVLGPHPTTTHQNWKTLDIGGSRFFFFFVGTSPQGTAILEGLRVTSL